MEDNIRQIMNVLFDAVQKYDFNPRSCYLDTYENSNVIVILDKDGNEASKIDCNKLTIDEIKDEVDKAISSAK